MRALFATFIVVILLVARVQGQMFGGDRHKSPHGCIASAGYTWCEAKSKCLKIWEEECPTSSAKNSAAEAASASGSSSSSKCSNGRTWCETMGQCMEATSMTTCPEVGHEIADGNQGREACQTSAGFMWCAEKNKCLQPWVEVCKSNGVPLHASAPTATTKKNQQEEILNMNEQEVGTTTITDKMDLAQHQAAAAGGKKKKAGGARRVSVVPGQDSCMSMIEGEEMCEKTGTCMPVEDCEKILPDGQTNQAGYQHGVKPKCESMVMGVEWCEKAKRCMSSSECAKLNV